MLARKAVKQFYTPSQEVLSLMNIFRLMTNVAIRIGLTNDVSTMKRLCILSYKELRLYNVPSYYKLCAISKASGILASRKKSIRRGYTTKDPHMTKPILVSYRRFRVVNGKLRIPIGQRKFEEIPLTKHTQQILSDPTLKVNSFTLTERSMALCISKEVQELEGLASTVGIDRNLRNLTVGNSRAVMYYEMSKVCEIGETTKDVVKSFKRNDIKVRKEIASKYGRRRKDRIQNILHRISKQVVQKAKTEKSVIVFEDIRNIRNMYRKGNGQGRDYRRQMNNWPYAEIKRQIEYKALWEGIPVIQLTKSETRGTSSLCPKCGERLQSDRDRGRELWCEKCKRWLDRDLVAVMNISYRGWLRFSHSDGKGPASEAMVEESGTPVILQVDVGKLTGRL